MKPIMSKFKFYLLSFTWGFPLTLVGCFIATILLARGFRPKKWGYCYYFEVGKNWGGLELGIFFLKGANSGIDTNNHEHGHAIQNCYLGFLMPILVSIPSAIRYWLRRLLKKIDPKVILPPYDSIWFEGGATRLGAAFMNNLNNQH